MTKVLKCGEVQPGCDFEIRGNSEEEVMKRAGEHVKAAHGVPQISAEFASKVRSSIYDDEMSQS